jgi:hypothetical protein
MYQNNPVNTLPTMYDLPSEDPEEMGLPSAEGVSLEVSSSACPARDKFHYLQPNLLAETCLPAAEEFFIGVDLNLYYDVEHTGWYKRPDWFLVLGRSDSPEQSELRLSYLIWQEYIAPLKAGKSTKRNLLLPLLWSERAGVGMISMIEYTSRLPGNSMVNKYCCLRGKYCTVCYCWLSFERFFGVELCSHSIAETHQIR